MPARRPCFASPTDHPGGADPRSAERQLRLAVLGQRWQAGRAEAAEGASGMVLPDPLKTSRQQRGVVGGVGARLRREQLPCKPWQRSMGGSASQVS